MQIFDAPLSTNEASLARVLQVGLPTLLVFLNGAPEADLEASYKRVAREGAGKLLVVKLQAGESPEAVRRYQVTASPALVALRDGQVVSQAEAISGADVDKHAAYLLGKGPKPQPAPATGRSAPGTATRAPEMGQPVVVTDATFDQMVLKSPQPVLVDFWAPWCGPCRMVGPVVDKLARENPGQLRVAKVNVDENPQIATTYSVRSIPTMMVVQNGAIVDRWVGALPEGAIRTRMARWL